MSAIPYKQGLKAGVFSGFAWAVLVSCVGALSVYMNKQIFISTVNQLPPNETLGASSGEFAYYLIGYNAFLTLIVGIGFGALIGVIFAYAVPKFLQKQSYVVKGVIFFGYFWVAYELLIATHSDIINLFGSLAASFLAGYVLGFLYLKYSKAELRKVLE